jgi:hypothetical protein
MKRSHSVALIAIGAGGGALLLRLAYVPYAAAFFGVIFAFGLVTFLWPKNKRAQSIALMVLGVVGLLLAGRFPYKVGSGAFFFLFWWGLVRLLWTWKRPAIY